jgi:Na+-driven multidrug efflux pump
VTHSVNKIPQPTNFSAPQVSGQSPHATAAAARKKLLLEGPIVATLFRLAAPNIMSLLAFVGVIIFDGYFLGQIGTSALAGASLAFPFVMMVLHSTNSGLGAGVSSAVARAIGAGQQERAYQLMFHALVLALILAAILSLFMGLAGPLVFRWMGGRDEVLADALSYANIAMGGSIVGCIGLGLGLVFACQGYGRAFAAMLANGVRLFANAVGALAAAYWFGFGLTGFCIAVALGFVLYAALLSYSLQQVKNPQS